MSRKYVGTEIDIDFFPTENDVAVDPDSVTFEWKIPGRDSGTETPQQVTTGQYRVTLTPEYPGFLYYVFKGTANPAIAEEGTVKIEPSRFDKVITSDYRDEW